MYFSDIEGFTSISEKMNPEELVKFLREYLGEMSDIILDEK
jgi:adenylate cyclase